MKKMIWSAAALFPVILSLLLFSFHRPDGGEGFEVYIGKRLVAQQFGVKRTLPVVSLEGITQEQPLAVHYYHCGMAGKQRILTLRDEQNNLLKRWTYGDTSRPGAGMLCPVHEMISLVEKSKGAVTLGYAPSDLASEKKLITLQLPVLVRK